jgi:hypothetical protein
MLAAAHSEIPREASRSLLSYLVLGSSVLELYT